MDNMDNTDWQSGKNLTATNLYLMENKIATDVCFVFEDGKKLEAHRLILMSRSNVFYVMFEGSLKETNRDIEIKDISYDVFKDMMKYMYTEEIAMTKNNAYGLLYAAEKYQLLLLKNKCGDFLSKGLTSVKKALKLLGLAKKYNVDTLSQICTNYLIDEMSSDDADFDVSDILTEAVLYKEQPVIDEVCVYLNRYNEDAMEYLCGKLLSKEALMVLLDCDGLCVDEASLFILSDNWATEACQKQGRDASAAAKREMLDALLYMIRFPIMTLREFTETVSPSELLTLEEEVSVFRYIGGDRRKLMSFISRQRVGLVQDSETGIVTIQLPRPWRLVGLKLAKPTKRAAIEIVDGDGNAEDIIVKSHEAKTIFFGEDYHEIFTFDAYSTVEFNFQSDSGGPHGARTEMFDEIQVDACAEWAAEVEYAFSPVKKSPLGGIVYQVKNCEKINNNDS